MSVVDLLDILGFIAAIIFAAMVLNIIRRFLLSENATYSKNLNSKEDRWTKNTRNLYQGLKVLAYSLTILVVSLGILTALDIFNFKKDGLTLPLLYMVAVAGGEASKIWTVQAFARHPSLPIFFTALIALSISIFFASESLFNISSQVQKHSNFEIDNLLSERASNDSLIEEYKQQILSLKKKENRKVHPAQQSQEFRSLESTLESVNKDIQKLSKEKEQIIQANNGNSKQSLNNEVKTLIDLKNNTENKIAEERAFYSQEVKNLHQARNDAVASAGFSRKKSLDVFYQDRISSLEKGFKAKIDLLEEDLNGYMVKIEKKRSNEESLNKLSPATTDSLKKIEKQMDEAERKKQEIFDQLDSMSKQKDLEMDILDNEIQNKQILINSLSEKQIRLDEKIAKTKNNNFLYILAASFYGKPPLEISPTEQMSFSFYFVGLGAVFLALLPSLLAILSVMLEKSIEKPVTNKISYKQLIHDSFIAINFTLKEILQKLASKKEDKHKIKIAYESKIKLEKDKVQKELEEHKDEFRKILLSKDNMIAKLENKNFVVAREAKHERELNNNSRDLKELRDKFRELENFFEEERERRTREEEQKNFQEEKSQERRDLMEELVQILQKKYEKNN